MAPFFLLSFCEMEKSDSFAIFFVGEHFALETRNEMRLNLKSQRLESATSDAINNSSMAHTVTVYAEWNELRISVTSFATIKYNLCYYSSTANMISGSVEFSDGFFLLHPHSLSLDARLMNKRIVPIYHAFRVTTTLLFIKWMHLEHYPKAPHCLITYSSNQPHTIWMNNRLLLSVFAFRAKALKRVFLTRCSYNFRLEKCGFSGIHNKKLLGQHCCWGSLHILQQVYAYSWTVFAFEFWYMVWKRKIMHALVLHLTWLNIPPCSRIFVHNKRGRVKSSLCCWNAARWLVGWCVGMQKLMMECVHEIQLAHTHTVHLVP